jgi:hypothetical protein
MLKEIITLISRLFRLPYCEKEKTHTPSDAHKIELMPLYDWSEAVAIARETQRRLDSVVERNEHLYERATRLAIQSRQLQIEIE